MLNVTSSVVINKPVAEVFAFVTDAENDTKWEGGLERVIPEGPQNVVGAKYTEVRRFMGQEMKSTLEVTAYEKDVKWGAKVLKGSVPYEATVTFEPQGGGTVMTTHVEGEPKGFFKLAEGALKSEAKRS